MWWYVPLQVKQLAGRCRIVGKRHPIALVHTSKGSIIEVSSISSFSESSGDVAALAKQTLQVKPAEHCLSIGSLLLAFVLLYWHS